MARRPSTEGEEGLFRKSDAPCVVTSGMLLKLLAEKHTQDVFVPECKTGPTWYGNPIRLDAWAMKRSWASPVTWGYEVKVSRGDFMRDDKWQGYLGYCSDFYMVCPPNLIQPNELPAGVGLLYSSTNAKRLYTKVKAVRRDAQVPRELLVYVLMSRAEISSINLIDRHQENRADRWRAWLAKAIEERDLGRLVGKAIQETIAQRIQAVESENHRLRIVNEGHADIRRMLVAIGENPDRITWDTNRRVREAIEGVPPDFLHKLQSARERIAAVQEVFEKLAKRGEQADASPLSLSQEVGSSGSEGNGRWGG